MAGVGDVSVSRVVLIAEESPTARAILGHILKTMLFDVKEAADRGAAVTSLSEGALFAAIIPGQWFMEAGGESLHKEVVLKCADNGIALIISGESDTESKLTKGMVSKARAFINISNDASKIFEEVSSILTDIQKDRKHMYHWNNEHEKNVPTDVSVSSNQMDKLPSDKRGSSKKKTELPKNVSEKKPQKLKESGNIKQTNGDKTILLVDDSPLIIDMNTECLQGAGYKIITASDGVEGAEKAFENMPDLIVSDVEMPRMNGYQMVRLLKSSEKTRYIPVVMNTTLSEARDRFWGKMAGADNYLVKGATANELLEAVKKTLDDVDHNMDRRDVVMRGDSGIDVVEQVNHLLDSHLFKSTIVSEVRSYSQSLTDFELTIKRILEFLGDLIDHEISILYLLGENEVFINVLSEVSERSVELAWEILEKETGKSIGKKDNPDIIILNETRVKKGGGSNGAIGSFIHHSTVGGTDRSSGSIVVAVFTSEKNKYGAPHRETLKMIADEARLVAESSFLYRGLDRANERNEKLQNLLRSYISTSAWEDAMETVERGGSILSEREKEYTILFSDICGFTSMSEKLSAKKVIDFLNTHFSFVTTVTQANHGDIDKYIGDCIMAKFEEPADAVRAAFQIQKVLHSGQHALAGMGIHNLKVRVGINTGTVIEGSIGGHTRKDYTVIGDAVNTASRVESACPVGGVMITETTYNKVSDIVDVISEDVIKVKGKEIELHVYVVAEKDKKR